MVRHQRLSRHMRPWLAHLAYRLHPSHYRLQIQFMACVDIRMYAVRRKDNLIPDGGFLRIRFRFGRGKNQLPLTFHLCRFQPHVNRRYPVMIRHNLHRRRCPRKFPLS